MSKESCYSMTLERAALGMEHRQPEAHFPKEGDEEYGKGRFPESDHSETQNMSEGGVGHGELGKKREQSKSWLWLLSGSKCVCSRGMPARVGGKRQKWVGPTSDSKTSIL